MLLQEYRANVTGFKGSCKYAQGESLRQANEEMCTSFNDPEGVLGLMQVGSMILGRTWGTRGGVRLKLFIEGEEPTPHVHVNRERQSTAYIEGRASRLPRRTPCSQPPPNKPW
jgi:hypothetical protein